MERFSDLFLSEVIEYSTRSFQAFAQKSPTPVEVVPSEIRALVVHPPEFKLGQAALPCHSFAKKFRVAPVKIAQEVASAPIPPEFRTIEKIEAVNGFLNFHCRFDAYGKHLLQDIRGGEYFSKSLVDPAQKEKIHVEYAQPNTHKALHVGHLRNMVFGDAVARILQYAGHDVIHATYPGDMGAHIAKALFYIRSQNKPLPKENHAAWLGRIYIESDDFVKSKMDTPEGPQNKAEVGKILAALQNKEGDIYELYMLTREWSLDEMREVYEWLGIHFDVWYFESECDEPSRKLVLEKFNEGFFQKSEGAVGIDLSQYGLGFAMFLKSDGNGLYLTKDLELIRRKFSDPSVTRSIVVVDARQKLHFQQLFKTAELMGYPQAAKSVHLSYESVTTPDGKAYSSRSGNGVLLHELRHMMEEKVVADYLHAYKGEWEDEEIQETATKVTLGALKYGFLRVDGQNIIRFMLEDWLKLEGDTGPYLQYVHARCRGILEKVGHPSKSFEVHLETEVERELLFHLSKFNAAALQAAESYRPSVVSAYLFDLCKVFNRFYKDCPIKTTEGAQKDTRLALTEATSSVLRKGLAILGIPVPHRM